MIAAEASAAAATVARGRRRRRGEVAVLPPTSGRADRRPDRRLHFVLCFLLRLVWLVNYARLSSFGHSRKGLRWTPSLAVVCKGTCRFKTRVRLRYSRLSQSGLRGTPRSQRRRFAQCAAMEFGGFGGDFHFLPYVGFLPT